MIILVACVPAPPPNAPHATAAAPHAAAAAPAPPAQTQDTYEALVAKAEAGEAVDFYQLRMAYLRRLVSLRGGRGGDEVSALQDEMFEAMHTRHPEIVFEAAQQILRHLYIDLDAQKARYQSCKLLNRPHCARYEQISHEMLRSVVRGRDGKTCATAWEVVSVPEEYFVIRMLDLKPVGQSLVTDGHVCDKLDVVDGHGGARTFYFDVGALLEASDPANHQK